MFTIETDIKSDEYWYGLSSLMGFHMPLSAENDFSFSLDPNPTDNQAAPLLLSNQGRYLWCRDGFDGKFCEGRLTVSSRKSKPILCDGFKNLRGAYLAANKAYFPPNGKLPPDSFYSKPQYNTWIELLRDQTQAAVIAYAEAIVSNGMPSGILMIDDGWSDYYGRWEFRRMTFPDPGAMTARLHELGFKVMLWTSPFITPDTLEFASLREKGLLVCNADGTVAIREWWNGFSAVLDLSNPAAGEWYAGELHKLMDCYGIDGFKFDGGDALYYREDDITYAPVDANGQSALWADFAEGYAYNELRACFACQCKALVQRLADRSHSWEADGLASLIPDILNQGILGYAFTCPDMIGGGQAGSFHGRMDHLDSELFVRWAQCSALMPMMQFSAAPWRVLPKEEAGFCMEAAKLHAKFAGTVKRLAAEAARTGEPIVRYMEYMFPGQGFAAVTDQFMLGGSILAAPVLQKGAVERAVKLPRGFWRYADGSIYEGGGYVKVPAVLETIPFFERAES